MATKADILGELNRRMDAQDRAVFEAISDRLAGMGYAPRAVHARGAVLQFVDRAGHTIAKAGGREGASRAFFAFKLYAAFQNAAGGEPETRFRAAVQSAADRSGHRYRCVDCGACGEAPGERGYPALDAQGAAYTMCGAYVVEVPDLRPEELDELFRLIDAQHTRFSRSDR